jgi:hypothetical protein
MDLLLLLSARDNCLLDFRFQISGADKTSSKLKFQQGLTDILPPFTVLKYTHRSRDVVHLSND